MTDKTTTTKPKARRTMSKARLYKAIKAAAVVYKLDGEANTINSLLEALKEDIVEEATR